MHSAQETAIHLQDRVFDGASSGYLGLDHAWSQKLSILTCHDTTYKHLPLHLHPYLQPRHLGQHCIQQHWQLVVVPSQDHLHVVASSGYAL
jgi:hypothetical protein